ncbi:protein kinase family protein [Rhodococcus triatomae]|nr:peptidoglycan lipid II flippase [Rhodococcus triatomae BKS 15-14]
MPGSVVGSRYRLLHCCGSGPSMEFWHGRDVVTDRDVGLTVLAGPDRDVDVDEVFARTVWMCGMDSPALARIVDMVDTGSGGVVAAEWQSSCSLETAASVVPTRSEAARSARPLTEAMRTAHRAGGVLDLEPSSRLRVGAGGHLYVAFPGTLPSADRFTDVRGLASALRGMLRGATGVGAPAW